MHHFPNAGFILLTSSQKVRTVCSSAPMHHAANCISSNPNTRGMYMSVNMLYQTVQILVTFSTTNYSKSGCCYIEIPFSFMLGMKRLISHVSLLFNIQLVLFSNTFETARYKMIIHVIVFLVIDLIRNLPTTSLINKRKNNLKPTNQSKKMPALCSHFG